MSCEMVTYNVCLMEKKHTKKLTAYGYNLNMAAFLLQQLWRHKSRVSLPCYNMTNSFHFQQPNVKFKRTQLNLVIIFTQKKQKS